MKGIVRVSALLLVFALAVVGTAYLLRNDSSIDLGTILPQRNFKPAIVPAEAHTILLVGDSMTDVLRPYDSEFRKYLAQYYPEKVFGIFNYGFGATNIESLPSRLNEETTYLGETYPAILDREFDFIFIESFGYNPLSNYELEKGLKLQENILTKSVNKIIDTHPNSVIVFVTTIAPNSKYFGKGLVDLTQEAREVWVSERREYIRNHANIAKDKEIYLLDIYQMTVDEEGEGLLLYINKEYYLHPSPLGIDLVNKSMADFLFENNLIP